MYKLAPGPRPTLAISIPTLLCPALPHLSAPTAEPKIALLGAMQSLFEGSMYTFVFLWTPALRCVGCGCAVLGLLHMLGCPCLPAAGSAAGPCCPHCPTHPPTLLRSPDPAP